MDNDWKTWLAGAGAMLTVVAGAYKFIAKALNGKASKEDFERLEKKVEEHGVALTELKVTSARIDERTGNIMVSIEEIKRGMNGALHPKKKKR